jgi:hypothetical protein
MLEYTSSKKVEPASFSSVVSLLRPSFIAFVVPKETAICVSHSTRVQPPLLVLRDQALVLTTRETRENFSYHPA